MKALRFCFGCALLLLAVACQQNNKLAVQSGESIKPAMQSETIRDIHSYSNSDEVRVTHIALDLESLFDRKVLRGTATLSVEPTAKELKNTERLILDTRDLKIIKVETSGDGTNFQTAQFTLGAADKILGASLTIDLPSSTSAKVRVAYETSPEASGVQWLEPAQTAGKKHPFMFTQSQAIHARSWIPLQDSPAVRLTYSARIRTPKALRAVMSAEQDADAPLSGEFRFNMPQAIPSYLIALAVGDIAFKSLGNRSGVYTEPAMLAKSAKELEDTEKMIVATEKLYGAYRWGRYDILVLPPSFPFGGMENPRLTFATPTILAGDKSLVSLIAHELAHSWSGNLVTNATWRDFWLNEGFTTYLERRIIEAIYGRPREEMEAVLARKGLEAELSELKSADQILHIDLTGRDPDEGFTGVPYEKGALFLRHLEETFGREKFDQFVKGYFDHFAFQSIRTADFVAHLKKNLLDTDPQLAAKISLDEWIEKPGLPPAAPQPQSEAFAKVEAQAKNWTEGKIQAAKLETKNWSTQQWLHFLKSLPAQLRPEQLKELDQAFNLTKTGNAEIAHEWLLTAIRNKYETAWPRLEEYLTSIGRQKLIRPLYEELMKTPEGKTRAQQIFARARAGYHPIAQASVGKIVQ